MTQETLTSSKSMVITTARHGSVSMDTTTNHAAKILASHRDIPVKEWFSEAIDHYPDNQKALAIRRYVASAVVELLG